MDNSKKAEFALESEPLNDYRAVEIAENCADLANPQVIAAWQYLIDTGLCWKLQGSFGRVAQALINGGYCRPAGGK
jgi:hypothetical protein